MNDSNHHAPAIATIEAARLLLEKMGVGLADLLATPAERSDVPVFEDYIPKVSDAVSDGTRRVYAPYWNRVLQAWPRRRITEPTPSEISQLAEHVKATAVKRRNARGGRGATEHLIAALRCLYNHAEDDGLITAAENPAAEGTQTPPPPLHPQGRHRRPASRDLPGRRTTGNDPELDTLLLRLHTETACRRGGALALRPDLDPHQCLIRLHEKGETVRWQPVSPTLMARLVEHGQSRHGPRQASSCCATATGGRSAPAAMTACGPASAEPSPVGPHPEVSMHWIRHTILTWVERQFGFAVAQAYAGHEDRGRGARSMAAMATYVRAGLPEVATALAALTGEPHPLAITPLGQ